MTEIYRPENDVQVGELVTWAAAEGTPLSILGRGTKEALGRATRTRHVLDLSGISGITFYEPEELVLQAKAGTPIADIEAALIEKGQMLAFEPPDIGPLLGSKSNTGSIGGTLACNLSGPRRLKSGAARDHFLGASAYSGRGELFKTGGRVVKNVTGYDLCKVLAGSYGTLGVMTDVTIKVLPAHAKTRTALVFGLNDEGGLHAMTQSLISAFETSSAAHLPASIASFSAVDHVAQSGEAVTALRVEGPAQSTEERCAALRTILSPFGRTEELHTQNSKMFWKEIGDVRPFHDDSRAVWRISVPPQSGPLVGALIHAQKGCDCFYDWGGGLVWAAMTVENDGGEAILRHAVAQAGGGHATLFRAPNALRESVAVFQPQEPTLTALNNRIKAAFDPKNILNPGRTSASP
jgi:glycolate oxidase FAD binding subunit